MARILVATPVLVAIALAYWIAHANGWLCAIAALFVALVIGLVPVASSARSRRGGGR